jgi:outer membrane protein assembly factor BamB
VLILTIALAGCGSSSDGTTGAETAQTKKSTAPPAPLDEYKKFQSSYADVDQQNTRDARSGLKAANVSGLEEAWSRPIEGTGEGEGFVASPIVTDDIVFVQDLDSNVAALNLRDGQPYWERKFEAPARPPGGLSVSRGFQMVMGATPTEAFGLDERSGKVVWSMPLAESGTEIGMTPGYYNGLAYLATQPVGQTNASGVLWGLDVRSGAKRLRFEPGKKGAGLGRGPTGLPAFDFKGSVYMGAGSPGPSSVYKFDENNGRLGWNHKTAPAGQGAGTWDPVIAELGKKNIVVVADSSGKVIALDRDGEVLWQHSSGSAVVGPIAVSEKTVFVPTGDGRQGFLVALSLANGTMQWKHGLQSPLAGPVLATNDLVFTTAADGRVYAFSAKSGKKLWDDRPSSAAEGGLAIGSQTLLVRVGTPGSEPGPELVAYRLPAMPSKQGSVADPGRDAAG